MDQAKFEELIVAVAKRPIAKHLNAIYDYVTGQGAITPDLANSLNLLWESWDEDELTPEAANFCVELAAHSFPASDAFRSMLSGAVETLLPPYLNCTAFLRALGLRDSNLPVNEIIWRFRKLEVLKNGTIVFRAGTWGVAGAPDNITGSVPVSPYGGRGRSQAVPMELILKEGCFFSPGLEMNRITDPVRAAALSSSDFRAMAKKRAVTNVSDAQLRQMALASAGKNMTDPDKFEAWWSEERPAVKTGVTGTRRACDGRSLVEIDMLLDKEAAGNAGKFAPDEAAALTAFFAGLKPETAARESVALAKVIAKLMPRVSQEELPGVLAPLKGKAAFWPAEPGHTGLEKFAVWGELPAKILESLAQATAVVFEDSYLAECALRLPLKALNAVCEAVSADVLFDTLSSLKTCGSDLLLWIWKNRRKVDGELLTLVNIENVVRSLSQEKLPKAWGPAQRELRVNLLEKGDFQKQLIASSGNDAVSIAATLQGALFLSPGERQSLLVKLSRQSAELRDYIENGAGQRILNAGLTAADRKVEVPEADEPNFTSIKSHQRLLQELDDIINIHTPENREALKAARAHGDFRENAEFDAAKERRNFLSRRRGELERELARVQPVSFRTAAIGDEAVIGSQVELTDDNGEVSTYYLLGAWDGNPDKNYLSYRTRLGQSIYGHKQGSRITMPNGSERILSAVRPLPESVLAEME